MKPKRRVFGFGETVFDIIFKDGQPLAAKPGGSVLNSFVSLGRLDWNPCFISEYGRDSVGELIDLFLHENGVDTQFVNRFSDGKSALALAFLDKENNASYSFYKDFPVKRLQELPDDLREDDIVLFGSIYASNAEVRSSVLRFLELAKNAGALIIYDPNFREAHLSELEELKPRVLENLEYADIIRGSNEDFQFLFGIDNPEELGSLINTDSKILVYTKNTEGIEAINNSFKIFVPSEKLNPVSTIGAGDNFNAGMVHYLLEKGIQKSGIRTIPKDDIQGMVQTGVKFASHVCMQYDNYISKEFAAEFRN